MPQRAFFIALMLVAANMRPAVTGVGPLLETIRQDLGLSATVAGVLASLPVMVFAALAPLARLAGRMGAERLLLAGMLGLIAGLLVRSTGFVSTLFIGTVVLATGIALMNVLMAVLIKQHYPERVPSITTAYATTMGGIAALASGVSVPMSQWLPGGWRGSMASWVVLAVIGALFWLPHARRAPVETAAKAASAHAAASQSPWRTALAWQITAYMGVQSAVFYISISWFPAILRETGFTAAAAGWLLTLLQVAALLAGLAMPPLMQRYRDQRGLTLVTAGLATLAVLGILLAPKAAVLWVIVLGCGSGPSLILSLSFMGLRAKTPQSAATLSMMSQVFGYLIAAIGPIVFGLTHDFTHGWTLGLLGVVALTLLQGVCGLGAGRARKV
ncbi:MAG: MFS transporter [Nevskiaceae bacterium]|jgi:CP family cyanate transporter-like MFS transporter|nr:MFS transporter [Nevskiaceae bacterium]